VEINLPDHTSETSFFRFATTLDEGATNESWGLRNLKISYGPYVAPNKGRLVSSYFTARTFAAADTLDWSLSGNWGPIISECAGMTMMGGYGCAGNGAVARKAFDFPPHTV
jgi:hypothetical protein